jgi:2-dehydropantoate 2-reductase
MMRVVVYGTGGAGGYFGAQLALSGEQVIFVARGDHLKALRANGLRLETSKGDTVIHPVEATDDPATVTGADVVLVGVKAWQVPDAAQALQPLVGRGTSVVPLQNGVEAASQLSTVLGADHVLGGMCGTLSWIAGPGHIRSASDQNFIKFGELDNRRSERVERLHGAFARAAVSVEVPSNIGKALWDKSDGDVVRWRRRHCEGSDRRHALGSRNAPTARAVPRRGPCRRTRAKDCDGGYSDC